MTYILVKIFAVFAKNLIIQILRRLREKFGLSQEKLCAELQCRNCDIGRSTYAKYENGELNIRISVLMELKKIYNCSYDEFFDDLDSH